MKKIKNTAKLGWTTIGLNCLIMIFFVITMISLSKFDKVNVPYVKEKIGYDKASEKLRDVERPLKQSIAEEEYYQTKLDTMKTRPIPTDKKLAKTLSEDMERTKKTLAEKHAIKMAVDSVIAAEKVIYEPIYNRFIELQQQKEAAQTNYNRLIFITLLLFIVKIISFSLFNWQNAKNLWNATEWMKKGSAPFWAFVGWIIPVYNFVKPYAFFSEIWTDSDYLLKDKEIIANDGKDDNADFNLGIWWGLLLICILPLSWMLHATFVTEGPMFFKLSHLGMIYAAIIVWAMYLAQECNVIRLFIKKNKLMTTKISC